MSSQIFSQAQLKGLSTTLQVANYASAQFINNSNYGFTLSNANNNEVINYVEPWSNTVIRVVNELCTGIISHLKRRTETF